MQKQPFPVRGGEGESKKFEDWGVKNFRIGGGQGVTDLGCYFWWGGGAVPHYMPCQSLLSKFCAA